MDFYRGNSPDSEGRRLMEVWAFSDDDLELAHDWVQWLFPLREPSRFNPDAPLLTDEEVAAFQTDPLLHGNLRRSFERFLAFLGLEWIEGGRVTEGPNFPARVPEVWSYPNHNWLRITRVLSSLRLLGLGDEARALYDRLKALYTSRRFPITADTFKYWSEAVQGMQFHA
jgi:hypothetical protein